MHKKYVIMVHTVIYLFIYFKQVGSLADIYLIGPIFHVCRIQAEIARFCQPMSEEEMVNGNIARTLC